MSHIYFFISRKDKLVRLAGTDENKLIDLGLALGYNPDTHDLFYIEDGRNSGMGCRGNLWYITPQRGDKVVCPPLDTRYIYYVSRRSPTGNWVVHLDDENVVSIAYLGMDNKTNTPVWKVVG